jgi:phosphoglycolate phosphatase-like HAD superfamily hydrolase
MNKINLFFWDFDGTICDSPMPETHKQIWKEKTGKEYPYHGWWGKVETLDPDVFDIEMIDKNIKILKDNIYPNNKHFILTARLPKFEKVIREILTRHGLISLFEDVYTINNLDKGNRIVEHVKEWNDKGFICT